MLILPTETVLFVAVVALVVDALTGEPRWIYRHAPHPVVLLGRWVKVCEMRLWRQEDDPSARRRRGSILVVAVLVPALLVGALVGFVQTLGGLGAAAAGLLASTLLAQRSLVEHVADVASGLEQGLAEGRRAVARIVGRDPERLDSAGVARAAIESAAENAADGVVAPLFWLVLLGPAGLAAYKAINTLDSMVGYRSERYRDFGRTAARLDDVVNFVPARLTAALLLLGGGRPGLWRGLAAEARKHRSPNAGWPEAAMARLLDLRLAGPRVYAAGTVDDDWIGTGRSAATAADIRRATALLWRLWALMVALLVTALALGL